MEHLIPDCSENIIVGVFYNKSFSWYVTDKEIWFLDYRKRIAAFKESGFEIKEEYIDEDRQGLLLLDSDNASIFLERIKEYKVDTEWLHEFLIRRRNSEDESWFYDFCPSLYVDFDKHRLFSLYSEPASYEQYVPLNWEGSYFDFTELVPKEKQYWMSESNEDLLEKERI